MNRGCKLVLAGLLAWHGLALRAAAQFPLGGGGGYTQPYPSQPTISPFLNLNRPGTNPAINYFGLVKPQLQTTQQLQNLQQQQALLSNELGGGTIAPGVPAPIATTGHPVFYMDYGRFFPIGGLPNFGIGGGIGAGGGGGGGIGLGSNAGVGALGGAQFIRQPSGAGPNGGMFQPQ